MRIERREFLGQAAVLSGTVQKIKGAGDRVRVGLIGCGGRGLYVANYMRQAPGVEFAAVCDVYEPHAAKAREWAGGDARAYRDFRQLLDRKDIDAVLIATPDHWHAIPAVLACQAGKDVYVEKPLAHNVREGRAIVEAARRYSRVVQAGTQHRSAPHFAEIAGIVQSGALGEVRFVRVWNYTNMWPNGIGRESDSPVPEGLDWDFYLGPAPKVPFNRKRFLGTFRWFRDYAGGYITDYGTHRFATVHQVMGIDAPRTVSAAGGCFSIHDAGDVPDVLQVTYEYPGFVMSYEACMMNAHGVGGRTPEMKYYHAVGADDRPHGMAFYGTSGTIFADRIGYDIYPEPKNGSLERRHRNTTDATALHTANFIDCVRSRKAPAAEAGIGHRATIIGHLGNISYWTGRKLQWDAQREDFAGEPEASRLLSRQARKPWDLLPG